MEVERHAGALYTTFLVDLSGARAPEFHGLYCWYLSGLDTLSVGNVLGRLLPHSRGLEPLCPSPKFLFSFLFPHSAQPYRASFGKHHHITTYGSPGNGKV